MNLLVLNDEKLTVEMIKNRIAWKEYGIDQVYTAYDAEEGKEKVDTCEIDIVLCDIEMPGENGIEFMRWVRQEKKNLECIFLTCHASFEYAKDAITLECQDYILMPADYLDIGNAVKKVVKRILLQQEEKRFQEVGRQIVQNKTKSAIEEAGTKMKPDEIVSYVLHYIEENLSEEDLSVNDIAKTIFLHPVYLNRLFKKEKEISISQYIINKRLNLAAALIAEGKLNLNTIAEQVGYRSYQNFNLAFKKRYQCSPIQYQKKQKGLLL